MTPNLRTQIKDAMHRAASKQALSKQECSETVIIRALENAGIKNRGKTVADVATKELKQAQLDIRNERETQRKVHRARILSAMQRLVDQEIQLSAATDEDIRSALDAEGIMQRDVKTLAIARRDVLNCQLLSALWTNYRTCVNGTDNVIFGSKPQVHQMRRTSWDLYRGSFKGWAADIDDTTLIVRKDYRKRVTNMVRGKYVILDQQSVKWREAFGSSRVCRIVYIKQERGNSLKAVAGYLVENEDESSWVIAESLDEAFAKVLGQVLSA